MPYQLSPLNRQPRKSLTPAAICITFYKNIPSTKIACLRNIKIKFRSFRSGLAGSRAHHVVIIDFGYVCKFRQNWSSDSNVVKTKKLIFDEAKNLGS